jgi:hypothetical protein
MIYNRVMFNQDVATGNSSALGYSSVGRDSAWSVSAGLEYNKTASCYVWDVLETCTAADKVVLNSGKAITKNFVLIGSEGNSTTAA